MAFSLVYLGYRFFYRIGEFFRHWYVDGLRAAVHAYMSVLEAADRVFAVAITIRYFFAPLYGDYSIVGRIVGVVFRTFRIALGSVFYAGLTLVSLFLALIWISVPLMIIAGTLGHLPEVSALRTR